ncbi:MAG: nicotinamide mononucleotide transporter [Deltaproteobacteria bacterium]|nr:nicotinamide mononucleotide transporter [Deltaproteobacteria bacterium]
MTPWELVATVAGFLCVLLTMRQNIWCWPVGLLQTGIYVWLFWNVRLYSDFGLQLVYIVLQLFGWWNWLHGGRARGRLGVSRLGPSATLVWLGVGFAGTAALGSAMFRFTAAALPFWDAAQTSLSLVAQWLMNQKRVESWLFWIAVDVLSVGIYYVKGLHFTSLLYAAYLVMATMGWFAWRKDLASARAA